jgi:hypothetical protein
METLGMESTRRQGNFPSSVLDLNCIAKEVIIGAMKMRMAYRSSHVAFSPVVPIV